MAKVKPGNLAPGATPLSRRRFLVRDTKHGPVAQAWPRPRGEPKTPYDWYKQTEFGIVGHLAANPHPLDLGTAIEMVKNSSLVPRDWLVMCAYANAYIFQLPDGTTLPRYRDMAPNPQYVLDLITTEVGSMIWRAEVGWIAIPMGNSGQVLTTDGTTPSWETPGSGPPPDIQELLDQISTAEGTILYRGADDWLALAPGLESQVLAIDALGVPGWVNPTGGGGGVGSVWELIASGTIANPTTVLDFDISAYSEVLFEAKDVTLTANGQRVIRLSTDGGATFWSAFGNYRSLSSSGSTTAAAQLVIATNSSSAANSILAHIQGINLTGNRKFAQFWGSFYTYLDASLDPVTDLRLQATVGDMTGGTYSLIGRV